MYRHHHQMSEERSLGLHVYRGWTTGVEETPQEVDEGMQGAVLKVGVVAQISFLLIISRPAPAAWNHSEFAAMALSNVGQLSFYDLVFTVRWR